MARIKNKAGKSKKRGKGAPPALEPITPGADNIPSVVAPVAMPVAAPMAAPVAAPVAVSAQPLAFPGGQPPQMATVAPVAAPVAPMATPVTAVPAPGGMPVAVAAQAQPVTAQPAEQWPSSPEAATQPTPDPGADLWHKQSAKPLMDIHRQLDRMLDSERPSVLERYEQRYGERLVVPQRPKPESMAKTPEPEPDPEPAKPKVVFKPKARPKPAPAAEAATPMAPAAPAPSEPTPETPALEPTVPEPEPEPEAPKLETKPETPDEVPAETPSEVPLETKPEEVQPRESKFGGIGGKFKTKKPEAEAKEKVKPKESKFGGIGGKFKAKKPEAEAKEKAKPKGAKAPAGPPLFGGPDTSARKRFRYFMYFGKNHKQERQVVKEHINSLPGAQKYVVLGLDLLAWPVRIMKVPYRGFRKYVVDTLTKGRKPKEEKSTTEAST